MRKCRVLYIITIVLFSSCVSHSKYDTALETIDSLKVANKTLLKINEELSNGEERLVRLFNFNVSKGNYILAEENFRNLIKYHPESDAIKVISDKIKDLAPKIQAQRDSILKSVKDSTRLANLNDFGSWEIGEYVNDFREPTGEYYVYQDVQGYFSNTATSHGDLLVHINISGDDPSMSIRCDEYMDGTIDGSGFGDASDRLYSLRVICYATRKIYKNQRYSRTDLLQEEGSDQQEESKSSVEYSLLDIFRLEHYYEIEAFGEYKTKYYYSVDTKGLENALLKAKLISLSELN